jgi:glycerophosphoryl diester phosphodiesterase
MKNFTLLALLVCLSACGTTTTPTSQTNQTNSTKRPIVIAHRGGANLAPENTLGAFKNGIALGADFIELDTHLSKDGVVMVMHDETVNRTTDGTGRVGDKTVAELQALNAAAKFKDGKYERQSVPTFAQVLDLLKNNTVRVEVEIKVPPQGRYVGIEEKLVKEIADRNLFDHVQVSSFNFDVLRDVKRANPRVKTVALMTSDFFRRVPVDYPTKVVDEAQAAGAELIAVNKDFLTADIVKEAQRRGLTVEVWTVDSEMEMKRLMEMGVDGIITNQPDVLKKLTR